MKVRKILKLLNPHQMVVINLFSSTGEHYGQYDFQMCDTPCEVNDFSECEVSHMSSYYDVNNGSYLEINILR